MRGFGYGRSARRRPGRGATLARLKGLGLCLGIVLASACSAPAPAAPTAAPAAKPTEAPKPAAAAPTTAPAAPAKPADTAPAKPAAAAPAQPSAAWQKVMADAKAEGSVLVYHNLFPGAEGAKVAEEFKRVTGIQADFITGLGAPLSQRIRTEIGGGQASADVFEGSPQFLGPMRKEGFFVSVKDKGLPSLAESTSVWRVNPTYISEDQDLLVSRPITQYAGHLIVNTNLLKPEDYPKSYNDVMTNPKYKGKIGYIDPKTTGDAAAVFIRQGYVGNTVTLSDFWTLYANQNPMMFPGPGDQGAATGRGENAVSIGTSFGNLLQQAQAKAPIKIIAFPDAPIVSNPSTMGILKTGKHPNAALVFVNWYYSKEGQDYVVKLMQLPSGLRRDVDSQVPEALNAEVPGGGKRGPNVVLTHLQSQLAADLNGAQVFQKLPEGISKEEFESKANAFIKDWESKNGGPQKQLVTLAE